MLLSGMIDIDANNTILNRHSEHCDIRFNSIVNGSVVRPLQFECWIEVSSNTSRRALRISICGSCVYSWFSFNLPIYITCVLQVKKKLQVRRRKKKQISSEKRIYMKLLRAWCLLPMASKNGFSTIFWAAKSSRERLQLHPWIGLAWAYGTTNSQHCGGNWMAGSMHACLDTFEQATWKLPCKKRKEKKTSLFSEEESMQLWCWKLRCCRNGVFKLFL